MTLKPSPPIALKFPVPVILYAYNSIDPPVPPPAVVNPPKACVPSVLNVASSVSLFVEFIYMNPPPLPPLVDPAPLPPLPRFIGFNAFPYTLISLFVPLTVIPLPPCVAPLDPLVGPPGPVPVLIPPEYPFPVAFIIEFTSIVMFLNVKLKFENIFEFDIATSTLELSKLILLKFSKVFPEINRGLLVFIVTFVIPHSFLKLDR